MRLRTTRDIAALVRDKRQAAGLTQAALAERAGVSRRWLAALEAGKPSVEVGLVLRVLAAVGVELDAAERSTGPAPGGVDLDDLLAGYEQGDG